MMGPAFHVEIAPAPMTPLNLQLGTIYAPRAVQSIFVAYECREVGPSEFTIIGYEADRHHVVLWRGAGLAEAWYRLAHALGMAR